MKLFSSLYSYGIGKKKSLCFHGITVLRDSLILKCLPLWTWPKLYKDASPKLGCPLFGSDGSTGQGPVVSGSWCKMLSGQITGKFLCWQVSVPQAKGLEAWNPGCSHFSTRLHASTDCSGFGRDLKESAPHCYTGTASVPRSCIWTQSPHTFMLASEKSEHLNKLYSFPILAQCLHVEGSLSQL